MAHRVIELAADAVELASLAVFLTMIAAVARWVGG
jgi:hypothetical protein